jgi:hypothetical protein
MYNTEKVAEIISRLGAVSGEMKNIDLDEIKAIFGSATGISSKILNPIDLRIIKGNLSKDNINTLISSSDKGIYLVQSGLNEWKEKQKNKSLHLPLLDIASFFGFRNGYEDFLYPYTFEDNTNDKFYSWYKIQSNSVIIDMTTKMNNLLSFVFNPTFSDFFDPRCLGGIIFYESGILKNGNVFIHDTSSWKTEFLSPNILEFSHLNALSVSEHPLKDLAANISNELNGIVIADERASNSTDTSLLPVSLSSNEEWSGNMKESCVMAWNKYAFEFLQDIVLYIGSQHIENSIVSITDIKNNISSIVNSVVASIGSPLEDDLFFQSKILAVSVLEDKKTKFFLLLDTLSGNNASCSISSIYTRINSSETLLTNFESALSAYKFEFSCSYDPSLPGFVDYSVKIDMFGILFSNLVFVQVFSLNSVINTFLTPYPVITKNIHRDCGNGIVYSILKEDGEETMLKMAAEETVILSNNLYRKNMRVESSIMS